MHGNDDSIRPLKMAYMDDNCQKSGVLWIGLDSWGETGHGPRAGRLWIFKLWITTTHDGHSS